MEKSLTIGQLVKQTGLSNATLQQFVSLGVLRPNPATRLKGRGMLREFEASEPYYDELTFCMIAAALKNGSFLLWI